MTDDRRVANRHGGGTNPADDRRGLMEVCRVAKFMDVHSGFFGVTAQQLAEAHQRDLDIEKDEGVHYEHAWMDPEAGKVFCLATGPSKEAVMRVHERAGHPTPDVYEVPIEVA
jgi:Protein of unknown function (DUF4242)